MASFKEILDTNTPVLVDFHATWCGPCKTQSPLLDQLKKEMGEAVKIIKIDVDKNQALAAQYQVSGVPTLMLFKNGQSVWRASGVHSPAQLKPIIQKHA